MKALTTLAAAAALSLGIASASQAAVFAQFSAGSSAQNYSWVKGGSTNGSFTTLGHDAIAGQPACNTCAAVHFGFLDPALATLDFLPAQFTLSATETGVAATQSGAQFTQGGIGGNFHITYYDPTKGVGTVQNIGGFNLTNGVTNLLSGVFNLATITGAGGNPALGALNPGGSGSANFTSTGSPSFLNFTSDLENFSNEVSGSEGFAFNLLTALPQFTAGAGSSLSSFTANGGGNFSFDTAGVPEPATWGLMIVGFGGMGMVLRARRRPALAKA
jgi:hypothetical protein